MCSTCWATSPFRGKRQESNLRPHVSKSRSMILKRHLIFFKQGIHSNRNLWHSCTITPSVSRTGFEPVLLSPNEAILFYSTCFMFFHWFFLYFFQFLWYFSWWEFSVSKPCGKQYEQPISFPYITLEICIPEIFFGKLMSPYSLIPKVCFNVLYFFMYIEN